MKAQILVSSEMTAFVGNGGITTTGWPVDAIGLSFRLADATFALHPDPADIPDLADADLVFIVAREACRRIFGAVPTDPANWHLPSEMRAIALALHHPQLPDSAHSTFRLAKSIELLCATFGMFTDGALIPANADGKLSAGEAERIVAARRMIDEHWHEKLTLDTIARTCGLNRAKLTRGFRAMFDCSVSDAIAERRLGGARQMLLVTDLPVSSIGYRCGYLNNASFTRAFSRRFGLAPTRLRADRIAA
ncbi:MAG: AraC family transcriptional regulator [Sphingomonadales bacterium]|nr:AraC family transcriptional regulator [Sphingomonadales bacterium]